MTRQYVFIGDVQGCSDELDELLARMDDRFGEEAELWVAGDLVNRGPNNLRPLERIRERVEAGQARYVLGNHEINLISVFFGLRELSPNDTIGDVLGSSEAEDWIDWLCSRPLVISGQVAGQDFAMLHASASPEWSFREIIEVSDRVSRRLSGSPEETHAFLALDPSVDPVRNALARLTRGRSVTPEGSWSSAEPASPNVPWHQEWLARDHDYGIVYGHWARQGLHVAKGLRGLDTGCVHHGRGKDGFLTAWLPASDSRRQDGKPFDVPDESFWQIPARRQYYNPET